MTIDEALGWLRTHESPHGQQAVRAVEEELRRLRARAGAVRPTWEFLGTLEDAERLYQLAGNRLPYDGSESRVSRDSWGILAILANVCAGMDSHEGWGEQAHHNEQMAMGRRHVYMGHYEDDR